MGCCPISKQNDTTRVKVSHNKYKDVNSNDEEEDEEEETLQLTGTIKIEFEEAFSKNPQIYIEYVYQSLVNRENYIFDCNYNGRQVNMQYDSREANGISLVLVLKNQSNILNNKGCKVPKNQCKKFLSAYLIEIEKQNYLIVGIGRGYSSFVKDITQEGKGKSFESKEIFFQECLKLLIYISKYNFELYRSFSEEYKKDSQYDQEVFVQEKSPTKGYQVVYNISKIPDLLKKGFKITRCKGYNNNQKIVGRIAFYGRENRGKTFMIKHIFNQESLSDGFNIRTQGLSMIHLKQSGTQNKYIVVIDTEGSTTSCDRSDKTVHNYFQKNIDETKQHFIMQKASEKNIKTCVIDISNIIVLVVSSISDEEQYLMRELISNLQEIQKNIDLFDLCEQNLDESNQYLGENQKEKLYFQICRSLTGKTLSIGHFFFGNFNNPRIKEYGIKCFKQIKDYLEALNYSEENESTDDLVLKSLERSLNKNLNFYYEDSQRKEIESIKLKLENDYIKIFGKYQNITFEVAHNCMKDVPFSLGLGKKIQELTTTVTNKKKYSAEFNLYFDIPGYEEKDIKKKMEVRYHPGILEIGLKAKYSQSNSNRNAEINTESNKNINTNQQLVTNENFNYPTQSKCYNNNQQNQSQSQSLKPPSFTQLNQYSLVMDLPKISQFTVLKNVQYHNPNIQKWILKNCDKIFSVKGGVAQVKIMLFWQENSII